MVKASDAPRRRKIDLSRLMMADQLEMVTILSQADGNNRSLKYLFYLEHETSIVVGIILYFDFPTQ